MHNGTSFVFEKACAEMRISVSKNYKNENSDKSSNKNIDNITSHAKTPLTSSLDRNLEIMEEMFTDCDDIKKRTMSLGRGADVKACIFYVEVVVNNITIEESVIGKLLSRLMGMDRQEIYAYLNANALGITDVNELETVEDAVMGVMVGDGVIFIDGYDKAVKIKSKGYPMIGVGQSDIEKVIRGSREGFADALKANTALMRKRVRNNSFKVKEKIMGEKSNTTVAITYVEGIARQSVIDEINRRLDHLNVDGLTDSGIIEQLTEENEHSPFPQFQTTERPDKAAMAVLDGRVVLFVDNSPVGLILPTTYNSFFQTVDDYYNRHIIVTLARIIRYLASFLALSLPALYLAVVNYHPELLPTPLVITFAAARSSVPFPAVIEVILMELSFELLREAGVRVPGPMGSTIGIVGGLIIGQAAVTAGIVSPIIVIVVAITALSSFAITNEELSSTFRLLKYFMIILAYFFGMVGVVAGWIVILSHLAGLKSFGFPYLMPYVADEVNDNKDLKDSIWKSSEEKLKERSIFARQGNRKKK